jgi:hypothetical protein
MKDAKGHGSEARGGNAVETTYANSKGFGGLGKGHYAQLRSGQMVKLNPKAMIPALGSTLNPSQHTLVGGGQPGFIPTKPAGPGGDQTRGGPQDRSTTDIAAQHGIPTDHLADGSPAALKAFTDKYGGPRDNAAEQRGFNSGAREINRLKRQGK